MMCGLKVQTVQRWTHRDHKDTLTWSIKGLFVRFCRNATHYIVSTVWAFLFLITVLLVAHLSFIWPNTAAAKHVGCFNKSDWHPPPSPDPPVAGKPGPSQVTSCTPLTTCLTCCPLVGVSASLTSSHFMLSTGLSLVNNNIDFSWTVFFTWLSLPQKGFDNHPAFSWMLRPNLAAWQEVLE